MPHQVRQFDLARVRRIWGRTLELHLGLYKGYVEQLNKLTTKATRGTDAEAFARRFAFEHNGVALHELFFDALSGKATPMQRSGALAAEFKRSFGGYGAVALRCPRARIGARHRLDRAGQERDHRPAAQRLDRPAPGMPFRR